MAMGLFNGTSLEDRKAASLQKQSFEKALKR